MIFTPLFTLLLDAKTLQQQATAPPKYATMSTLCASRHTTPTRFSRRRTCSRSGNNRKAQDDFGSCGRSAHAGNHVCSEGTNHFRTSKFVSYADVFSGGEFCGSRGRRDARSMHGQYQPCVRRDGSATPAVERGQLSRPRILNRARAFSGSEINVYVSVHKI